MRGIKDSTRFLVELEKHFGARSAIGLHLKHLQNQVLDTPTTTWKSSFSSLREWSFLEVVGLCIGLQYCDRWMKGLLEEDIFKKARSYPPEYQIVVEILLSDIPAEAFCYLLETSLWSTETFFGNITKVSKQKIHSLRYDIHVRAPRVKYSQFVRGYKDKGSRVPVDVRARRSALSEYYRELQQKIESVQESKLSAKHFLRGWIG